MSYNPALPTALDRVRFAVGDTGDSEHMPDATYMAVLATAPSERDAIITMCDALFVAFAQMPSRVGIDGIENAEWRFRLDGWAATAKRLRAERDAESTSSTVASLRIAMPRRSDGRFGGEYTK